MCVCVCVWVCVCVCLCVCKSVCSLLKQFPSDGVMMLLPGPAWSCRVKMNETGLFLQSSVVLTLTRPGNF